MSLLRVWKCCPHRRHVLRDGDWLRAAVAVGCGGRDRAGENGVSIAGISQGWSATGLAKGSSIGVLVRSGLENGSFWEAWFGVVRL
jgi:hypothetical protein